MSKKTRKIGIFGGTFDPIHLGHINLAYQAYHQLGLDSVIFVPNYLPPHKDIDKYEDYNYHRLKMIEIAIKNYDYFDVSEIEYQLGDISYTYNTVSILAKIFKNDKLFFIMGDDSFFEFHTWVKPEIICEHASLVVGKRNEVRHDFMLRQKHTLEKLYKANVIFLSDNICELSSSKIREDVDMIEDNKTIPEVFEYIKSNNLYS